jgi:hypothetical protein
MIIRGLVHIDASIWMHFLRCAQGENGPPLWRAVLRNKLALMSDLPLGLPRKAC